jgi:hypothetical protein
MKVSSEVKDILSALWFGLVALAFFAPQAGIVLPMGVLTALYSLFLVSGALVLALSIVSPKGIKKHGE